MLCLSDPIRDDFAAAPLVATHPDDLALIDAIAEVARTRKAVEQAERSVNFARHWGEDLRPHEYALAIARHHLHEARVHLTQLEIRFGVYATTKVTKDTKVKCGTGTLAGVPNPSIPQSLNPSSSWCFTAAAGVK